ncbi:MAG: LEPR-XLL domain-containing protein [Rhodobacteraceae bacterium]|nr:LEPR-XLL domain-containing protein [Paracoccaceae bacterium]
MPKDAPSDRTDGNDAACGHAPERVFFEALEPRLLLSADLLPVAGSIDLPGEEDAYVFVLNEATQIHVDALTPGDFEWKLTSDNGETLAGARIIYTDGRYASSPAAIALASGTYRFSVAGLGAQTGEYRFALRDLADASTITPDTPVEGTLATGRENDTYEVTAEAGERISLAFEELTGATWFQLQARVTGPTGQEVLDSIFNPGTTAQSVRLPVSGTYFVTIEGTTPEPTEVTYRFTATRSVEPLATPLTGDEEPLPLDTRIDGRIDEADGVDAFRFSTATGGVFLLDALYDAAGTFPQPPLVVSLIDKHGVTLFDRGLRFNDHIFYAPPGDHLLQVRSSTPLDYAIALRDLGAAPVLSYGDTPTATLNTAADSAVYRFEADAGDIVRVAPEPAGSGTGPVWEIRDAAGDVVATGNDGIGRTTLARAGTYYLLIRGELDQGGERTFDFSLDRVTDRAGSLTLGTAVRGTLAPGGRDTYSFDIAAETTVILDSLTNSNLRFTIDGPDGRLVDGRALSSGASYSGAIVLGPGAHVLTISGVGTEAGEYGFRIVDTSTAPVIQPDEPVEGSITERGTADVLRIDLTDGQTLTVGTQNRGGGIGFFTLLSETGQILTRQILNLDFGPVTAVGDTTYYLMVDALHNAESVDYTLTPRIAKVIRDDLELETLTTAALDTPYSFATYDFTLDAPRTLHFETLINTPGGTVRVLDATGRVVATPSLTSDTAQNLMVLGAGKYRLEL